MVVGSPPLAGLKVLEFAGLAPGPYAGLILADAGASVLRIDRPTGPSSSSSSSSPTPDGLARHKSSLAVDIGSAGGCSLLRRLATRADVLIDPFRPGVLERAGLGPEELCGANPRLVYARMTGFRRSGRYAAMAGHDINYLAVAGVLALLPGAAPPINLLADFAGGGATLVLGVLLALLARDRSSSGGRGQVVEANMVDGSSYLASFPRFALRTPVGSRPAGQNLLDGGSPFYTTYETRDGRRMAVGALEDRFFARLVQGLGLAGQGWEVRRADRDCWPEMRRVFAERFKDRTRAEWEAVFDGTDACCTPVLTYDELRRDSQREGDLRPPVHLAGTPLLAVHRGSDDDDGADPTRGQGPGVNGDGYHACAIAPGEGGEEALREWLGWTKGVDFDVDESNGGLVLKDKSKL